MIKQLLHKSLSIGMALLVLFSTVSFTIEKHYCGDVLIDVSLFDEAKKCGMEASAVPMDSVTKKSCCKDTVDLIEGQDQLKISSKNDLDLEQQLFVASFVYTYLNLFEGLSQRVIPHKDYSLPDLIYDIHVLDQVFLI